ncbi:MAG: RNA methyltransferase [Paludibacteraceae bacterium]|nr:RNA methyltransferase [Paludibacteraceae bacterium]
MTNTKLTIQEMNRLTTEAFHQAQKLPFVVVLDNVRSRHNVGAVFRTADAFRMAKVYLCGICGCPPDAEIHKTALGAEDSMDWTYCKDTLEAVNELHAAGYSVYAIEQAHNSLTLEAFAESLTAEGGHNGIAVVLGHEVFGVQQSVIDACDGCIEIPQYGTKHSLNVSVTAGIVLYTIASKLISRFQDL